MGRARWRFPGRWNSLRSSLFFSAYLSTLTCVLAQQSGVIEQSASLLRLDDARGYNEHILTRAAKASEEADRVPEAIKLYNLAGDYATVVGVLARALGNTIGQPSVDEKARTVERTAADVLRHYERTNRAVGKERDAVIRLLRVREAMDAKDAGRIEQALEVRNLTGYIVQIVVDVLMCGSSWNLRTLSQWRRMLRRSRNGQRSSKICRTRCSATCRSSSRSPWTFLLLCTRRSRRRPFRMFRGKRCVPLYTVRCLTGLLTCRQTIASLRKKSRALIIFAGNLKYRMSPDVYSYLARLDVEIAL